MSAFVVATPLVECGSTVEGSGPPDVEVRLMLHISGDHPRDIEVATTRVSPAGEFELAVPTAGPLTVQASSCGFTWSVIAQDTATAVVVLPRGGLALWLRTQDCDPG